MAGQGRQDAGPRPALLASRGTTGRRLTALTAAEAFAGVSGVVAPPTWQYRIVYRVEQNGDVVVVWAVGSRNDGERYDMAAAWLKV